MAEEVVGKSDKPAAILEAEELARYRKVLGYLEDQTGLVQRARAALEQAEFVAGCVDAERARFWRDLCDAHGLDPEAEYGVDGAGRVFHERDGGKTNRLETVEEPGRA